jgi:hypothetical protein
MVSWWRSSHPYCRDSKPLVSRLTLPPGTQLIQYPRLFSAPRYAAHSYISIYPPSPQMADAPEVIPTPIEGTERTPEYEPHGQKYESEYKSTPSVPRIPATASTLEVHSSAEPTTSRSWGHGELERGGIEVLGSRLPSGHPNYEEQRHGHSEERETEDWQVDFWQCGTPRGLCGLKPCTNTSRATY